MITRDFIRQVGQGEYYAIQGAVDGSGQCYGLITLINLKKGERTAQAGVVAPITSIIKKLEAECRYETR
jgi:hypothetical protein